MRLGIVNTCGPATHTGAQLCSPAVTVRLHSEGDWMMHVVAEQLQSGDMVIAAITADNTDGFFGDLLATSFRARGATGLVINAGCCDIRELTASRASTSLTGAGPR